VVVIYLEVDVIYLDVDVIYLGDGVCHQDFYVRD
jgi:hypothetical protein